MSGRTRPSMPTSLQREMKRSAPYEKTTFAYVMKVRGMVTSLRSSSTIAKILSVVEPPLRALSLAAWITGPSAVGSEKGIPSSIRSAPALTASLTTSLVVSRSGSPQVMKGMNALPFSNALAVLLIDVFSSVSCDSRTVLVASAGDRYYDRLVLGHSGNDLERMSNGVSRLDGGDDSFCA